MIRDLYFTVVLIHQYLGIIRVGSWLAGIGPGRRGRGGGRRIGGYVDGCLVIVSWKAGWEA